VAPDHTAMADYFDDKVGYVIDSSAEPTFWPHDPDRAYTTTWARLNWSTLHDHFVRAYDCAKNRNDEYQRMASVARERMRQFAGVDAIWPRVVAALNSLTAQIRRSHPAADSARESRP
jgi:hypothetical protein